MSIEAPMSREWRMIGRMISAHLVMLRDVGLIDDHTLGALIRANESARDGEPASARGVLALVGAFDDRCDSLTPPGIAGAGRVGRGPLEIAAAVSRSLLREDLLETGRRLGAFRGALIEIAQSHVTTLVPASIDAIVAQPSTLGHLLSGAIAPLARAAGSLLSAVEVVDRSPLGAGSLASSGMPIDRERAAELAGFAGTIESTYDAVSATDHVVAIGATITAITSPVRRLAAEMIDWIRVDPLLVRLSDDETALHGNLPQFRGPAGLIDLQQQALDVQNAALGLQRLALDAGYGPVANELDRLHRAATHTLDLTGELLDTAADLFAHRIEINRALFANRTGKAFSTASDLADFLMIEEQIDPGAARNIAALTISRAREGGIEAAGITPELIDGAALLVIGREIKVEFEAISRYLAPRRFIERRTATGAPSPAATRAYLDSERAQLAADRTMLEASARAAASHAEVLAMIEAEAIGAAER